ncbi:MAG: hypothetical protein EOP06_29330 [Proteobacteria bacterium]|nr:MAG: hypothetical protein EOP06_29330 [Pseudomonadota bacterium]
MMFLFAMGQILKQTSYTIQQLSTIPWVDLFGRDELPASQIMNAVGTAITTGESQKKVTDWHEVTELQSKRHYKLLIRVKQITPFHSKGGIYGGFAVVESKRLPLDL